VLSALPGGLPPLQDSFAASWRPHRNTLTGLRQPRALVSAGRLFAMEKSRNEKKMEAKNVAKALAEVPIDNKQERDRLRAQLREKYAELKPLRLSKQARERFEQLGELLDRLEECENRPPQTRS